MGKGAVENYIGAKFGTLEVLGRDEVKSRERGRAFWIVKCECGVVKSVCAADLKIGRIYSCGSSVHSYKDRPESYYKKKTKHAKSEKTKNKKEEDQQQKKEKIKLVDYGYSAFKKVLYQYRRNAEVRELPFELSEYKVFELTNMPCYYCGIQPSQVETSSYGDYIYNGIDRIDSELGYTEDNVVPCCWTCNRIKQKMSTEDFIEWIKRVYDHFVAPQVYNDLICDLQESPL